MQLPRGVTVSVLDDSGAEVVIRIEGSARYVADMLAKSGGYALLALPSAVPGSEKRFDFIQGLGAQ
jgi:hypothetical protein